MKIKRPITVKEFLDLPLSYKYIVSVTVSKGVARVTKQIVKYPIKVDSPNLIKILSDYEDWFDYAARGGDLSLVLDIDPLFPKVIHKDDLGEIQSLPLRRDMVQVCCYTLEKDETLFDRLVKEATKLAKKNVEAAQCVLVSTTSLYEALKEDLTEAGLKL